MRAGCSTRGMRALVAACTGVLATACASQGDPRHGVLRVPEGAILAVHQLIRMPPGSARVYVQGGSVVSWKDVNWFVTYCSFGLDRSGTGQALVDTIEPGEFVTGSSRSWAEAEADPPVPAFVASRGWPQLAGTTRGRGGPGRFFYYTEVPLHSSRQPQVDDLTCSFHRDGYDVAPTVSDMRGALGGVASIRLPTD